MLNQLKKKTFSGKNASTQCDLPTANESDKTVSDQETDVLDSASPSSPQSLAHIAMNDASSSHSVSSKENREECTEEGSPSQHQSRDTGSINVPVTLV